MIDLQAIWDFLNTQAATSIIALIAASTAFIIYNIRKRDQKKDAANIILLEIKSADRSIDEARKMYEAAKVENPQAISFPEKLRLMPTESWTKYKYLFVRDLPAEQWDEISKFYENCAAYDEAAENVATSFYKNADAIRGFVQHIVATYSYEYAENIQYNEARDDGIEVENAALLANIEFKKNAAIDGILRKLVEIYTPDKPLKDSAYFFTLLPHSLLNTPTGEKLKNIATRGRFKLFRRA